MPDPRRAALLEAAKEAFSRYGYGRTSMADVAQIARISRPALYAHFRNKEDLFRSLAESLTETALAAADAAWPASAPFAAGLAEAVLAKDLEFFRLIHLSPHGAEILAQHAALTADLHADMETRFAALVARRVARAKAPGALGRIIARAMEGLKQGAATEAEFIDGVRRLASLLGAGLGGGPGD